MSTNFPTSLDTLTNPTGTDTLNNPDHPTQHANANDAIEALEAKVGVDGSAVTTSHAYKLGEVTSTDKAVGKTATQTLTNKTLTAPVINVGSDATGDIYYRNASGVFTRLPIGTSGQILQVSSGGIIEWVTNPAAADSSTSQKGVVEEGTQAEVDAGTAAGSQARLVVNPSTLRAKKFHDYAADAGASDSYAMTVSPSISAYSAGQVFVFKANTANTGAATLNVNSVGAVAIKKNYNSDLETGDILANQIVTVVYDGTNFQLQSGTPQKNYYVTASDSLQQSADTERSTSSASYTKLKEITVYVSGTYRVKFDMKASDLVSVNGRIYKNDSAYGAERTDTDTSYTTYSEDLYFNAGDRVQLYAKYTGGDRTVYVQNFRLYYDRSYTTADSVVNTN